MSQQQENNRQTLRALLQADIDKYVKALALSPDDVMLTLIDLANHYLTTKVWPIENTYACQQTEFQLLGEAPNWKWQLPQKGRDNRWTRWTYNGVSRHENIPIPKRYVGRHTMQGPVVFPKIGTTEFERESDEVKAWINENKWASGLAIGKGCRIHFTPDPFALEGVFVDVVSEFTPVRDDLHLED